MTKDDRNEMRELFHDLISGIIAKQDANYFLLNTKLDQVLLEFKEEKINNSDKIKEIDIEIKKINSDILKLKDDHTNCPQSKKIQLLETQVSNVKYLKKWLYGTIVLIGILITIILNLTNIFR